MMPKKGDEIVDVQVELLHETDKAYLVTIDGKTKVWVAKSVCELEHDADPKLHLWTLTLPAWMAEERGLV
jgi:hypothetical protein